MKNGLPKHCTRQRDLSGKVRIRFRTPTFSTYLTGIPWSESFMAQYAAALEGRRAAAWDAQPAPLVPGSIDALIESYYALVLPTLGEGTQAMRRGILERFRREHSGKPVRLLKRQHVEQIIAAKAKTPDAANNLRKILRHLMEHAIALGMIEHNPVVGTKRLKTKGDGIHTWTDFEIEQYRAHWPLGTQQRLCFEIALETTLRRSDVTKIGPQHIRGDKIRVHHSKNDSANLIPITPELRAAIDACPTKHLTFLHTKGGASRSPKALGSDFRKWCDAAGLPKHCSIHGLRKGGARRLAESEVTAREIMAITGHKTLAEVQRYTDDADRVKLAESAIAKLRNRARKNV
jgi:site-specific recombinase XerC